MRSSQVRKLTSFLIGALLAGCGGGTTIADAPAQGHRGEPCYGNGTCNAGLICSSAICVDGSDGGGDGGGDTIFPFDDGVVDTAPLDAAGDATDASDVTPAPPYAKTDLTVASCDDVAGLPDVPGVAVDDGTSAMAALPFAFKFFGGAVTTYSVCSNGFAQLWGAAGGTPSSSPDNVSIPLPAQPNNFVAPFWDDLVPVFSNVKAGALGASPSRRFVISWAHWSLKGAPGTRLTFQAKLFETTNVIEFHYCGLEGSGADAARAAGSSATVGLENAGGTAGVQSSFDTASLKTGTALRFTPAP